MIIDLCNRLVDNDLSRNDLLKRVRIEKTNVDDFEKICNTIAKAFGLNSKDEAVMQLMNANAILNESIKLVDNETGDIYGLLMFCDYTLMVGSPIIRENPSLGKFLSNFRQVNGHSFVIDERLRGTGLDKKMLFYNIKFLSENYDIIWIGVDNSLKTHKYWKRLGFVEVFGIPDAMFYILPFNKKLLE